MREFASDPPVEDRVGDAPVEVGTMFSAAARPRRVFVIGLSIRLWLPV